MRVLNIIETAYRATLEEQDDTIVWLVQSIKSAGGDVDLLLKGGTVNYAVHDQDASGLVFGAERQTQPPRLAVDLHRLIDSGVKVYGVKSDAVERGLDASRFIGGIHWISRAEVAKVLSEYDGVWYW